MGTGNSHGSYPIIIIPRVSEELFAGTLGRRGREKKRKMLILCTDDSMGRRLLV